PLEGVVLSSPPPPPHADRPATRASSRAARTGAISECLRTRVTDGTLAGSAVGVGACAGALGHLNQDPDPQDGETDHRADVRRVSDRPYDDQGACAERR